MKRPAFTLIELLIAIFIISLISSLVAVSFYQVRRVNRDSKRIADVSKIQLALESYKFFEGDYPDELIFGQPLIGSTTGQVFLDKVPENLSYYNYDCDYDDYSYRKVEGFYTIPFCLEGSVENYVSGSKCLIPTGIVEGDCDDYLIGDNGEEIFTCGDDFIDTRDNNIYPTVQIGAQCWLAKNLAYLPMVHNNDDYMASSSAGLPGYGVYGYDGSNVTTAKSQSNYITYGVLYNWYAVDQVSICPSGWHVPTHDELTDLERAVCMFLGNTDCDTTFPKDAITTGSLGANEGDALKSTSTHAWCNNPSECEESNFLALPVGRRGVNGDFGGFGSDAFFWSSSGGEDYAWARHLLSISSGVTRFKYAKYHGFSARCLRTE